MQYILGLGIVLLLSAGLPALQAEDGPWLDPRLQALPTDKLGPFVRLQHGAILALDTTSSFTSEDGGTTWSEGRALFTPGQNIRVSNERALLRTREGVLIAAFMNLQERHWTWDDDLGDAPEAALPTYVMRSLDEGATWQNVQKLHADWTGAIRDMIETKDGRIIFTAMKMQHEPGRHAVLTYSSSDRGESWRPSNLIDLGGAGHHGGVTEPTLEELNDGRVWMLIRTNWGEFWSATSYDGGQFWRVVQPSGIPASSAPCLLKRLESGRLILLWNRPWPEGSSTWPLSGGDNRWSATPVSNHREELSMAFSEDEGASWSSPVVIARCADPALRGSARWIAYPYLFEAKPGELWITSMQGHLRAKLVESDFVSPNAAQP